VIAQDLHEPSSLQQLREIGWTKARELAKVALREGERFVRKKAYVIGS